MDFSNREDYKKIFVFSDSNPERLISRESSWLEFKESFNWGSRNKYVKTMAAFANNNGGYIIFGVKDRPKDLVGLANNNFDDCDEAKISDYVDEYFSPEIKYEKFIEQIHGKNVGILFIPEAKHKPVICSKNNTDVLKESEIYYRYHGRSEKIKYSELKLVIDKIIEDERNSWWEHFEKMFKIGPTNAAILDLNSGKIDGRSGTLLIDKKLIPKLKFIKEGVFREGGKPVLKLVGDVKPVSIAPIDVARIKFTDDPEAPEVRVTENEVLTRYPLNFKSLIQRLRDKYKSFRMNSLFYKTMRELKEDKKFCWLRYLNPNNSKSASTCFYSLEILDEFDKYYKENS